MTNPAHIAPWFVCRCEEIAVDEVRQAIAEGALTVNDVKRRTKAGMGLCQGVYCVPAIARMIGDDRNGRLEVATMTARPPVRPIPLETLADAAPEEAP